MSIQIVILILSDSEAALETDHTSNGTKLLDRHLNEHNYG